MDCSFELGPQLFPGHRLRMCFKAREEISGHPVPDFRCPRPLVRLEVTLVRSFLMAPSHGGFLDRHCYAETVRDSNVDTFRPSTTSRTLYFNTNHLASERNLKDAVSRRIFLSLPMSQVVATTVFLPAVESFVRKQINLALRRGLPALDLSVLLTYRPILVTGMVTEEDVRYFRDEEENAALYSSMKPFSGTGDLWVPSWYERLERFDWKEQEERAGADECAVCFTDFQDSNITEVARLPCRHVFHEKCIEKWLLLNNTCPFCRSLL